MPAFSAVPSPASTVPFGQATCATLPFRHAGQLRLAVIVKASFSLVPNGPMALAAAEEIVRAEVHHRNLPTQSVRLTSDLAPFIPAADVVLTGNAYAPLGEKARAMTVRFGLFRQQQPLFQKSIQVIGDRKRNLPDDITPFDEMPLVLERAYGGIGVIDNPLGSGTGDTDPLPNLVDPTDPKKTLCFAPLAAGWPTRTRLLDRARREALKRPILELDAEFPYAHFNVAPEGQQVASYLQGNEWVELAGMHPTHPVVRSRLPDILGVARIFGLTDREGRDLPLVADTLRVDAAAMTCSLVWRGSFPILDEATIASLRIVAGARRANQSIDWAAIVAQAASPPAFSSGLGTAPSASEFSGTLLLADEAAPPAGREALPFVSPSSSSPDLISETSGTLAFDESVEQAPVLPFRSGPPAVPALDLARAEPFAIGKGETITLSDGDLVPVDGSRVLPFAEAQPRVPQAPPPAVPVSAPVVATPSQKDGPSEVARPHSVRRAERRALGIDLFPHGPFALDVVPFRVSPPRHAIAVIAKATADLVPDGPCVLRSQADPISGEIFVPIDEEAPGARGKLRGDRCVYPSDRVPYKVRADVVLVGHAYAPGGSTPAMTVAFRFGDGDNGFSRMVLVHGDRIWKQLAGSKVFEPSLPVPFPRIPIAFDRAYGGPSYSPNILGLGHHDPMARGPVPVPNLEDPEHRIRSSRQQVEPACFGPIPLAWKDRWIEKREAGAFLGDIFDWTRYQAAPPVQRLDFLNGNEPFAITGMSYRFPRIEGALPGIVARAFVARGDRPLSEVSLLLDTVVFDVDEMKVSLVFRGGIPVADEDAPGIDALYLFSEPAFRCTPVPEIRAQLLRS